MSDLHDHREDDYEHPRYGERWRTFEPTEAEWEAYAAAEHLLGSGPISPLDEHDAVGHPSHYTNQVKGVEAWDVLKYFPYLRGNAMKYLWRAGDKDDILQDLRKALAYINKEIEMIEQERYVERNKL